ncbi:MAG: hypothetical protein NTV62_01980 [Candidatus Gribaldobacteria bacterium]|nr:hypothetical protein [Candidatus Gribaldobacteria bacterium]
MNDQKSLFDRVMQGIKQEQQRRILRRKVWIFSISLGGSLIAIVPVSMAVKTGFTESGFFQFVTLIFSDFNTVATSWQSYLFSLLETLPVMSLVIFLVVLLSLVESLKYLTRATLSLRATGRSVAIS